MFLILVLETKIVIRFYITTNNLEIFTNFCDTVNKNIKIMCQNGLFMFFLQNYKRKIKPVLFRVVLSNELCMQTK